MKVLNKRVAEEPVVASPKRAKRGTGPVAILGLGVNVQVGKKRKRDEVPRERASKRFRSKKF